MARITKAEKQAIEKRKLTVKTITLSEIAHLPFLHRVAGYSIEAVGYYFCTLNNEKVEIVA